MSPLSQNTTHNFLINKITHKALFMYNKRPTGKEAGPLRMRKGWLYRTILYCPVKRSAITKWQCVMYLQISLEKGQSLHM